ncbi:type II toxin-antitoxin system PemK/MazF family toxin [Streptomyces sp. NPDC004609]|uniref:type II toxin-antitoxin system PemK/MazF family toxin n=1 Tax=Streptomyces sp. NPDC004609 TaxID=3364704 RepID=UPI0036CE3749
MDTWWWPVLGAVVLVALVVSVVDARRRRAGGSPRGRTRPPGRPSGPLRRHRPKPGEIWWADVPYEDGPGSKDRPCLVLSVRGATAEVAKITSRRHDGRPGVIALPHGAVGDQLGRASFLETEELRRVPLGRFRRRVGAVDPGVWERVRYLAR